MAKPISIQAVETISFEKVERPKLYNRQGVKRGPKPATIALVNKVREASELFARGEAEALKVTAQGVSPEQLARALQRAARLAAINNVRVFIKNGEVLLVKGQRPQRRQARRKNNNAKNANNKNNKNNSRK